MHTTFDFILNCCINSIKSGIDDGIEDNGGHLQAVDGGNDDDHDDDVFSSAVEENVLGGVGGPCGRSIE